jgi:hypothetical protein
MLASDLPRKPEPSFSLTPGLADPPVLGEGLGRRPTRKDPRGEENSVPRGGQPLCHCSCVTEGVTNVQI